MMRVVTETLVLDRQRKIDADMQAYLARGGVIRPYDESMRVPVRYGRSPRPLEDLEQEGWLQSGLQDEALQVDLSGDGLLEVEDASDDLLDEHLALPSQPAVARSMGGLMRRGHGPRGLSQHGVSQGSFVQGSLSQSGLAQGGMNQGVLP